MKELIKPISNSLEEDIEALCDLNGCNEKIVSDCCPYSCNGYGTCQCLTGKDDLDKIDDILF
jgi:hypothetical protein